MSLKDQLQDQQDDNQEVSSASEQEEQNLEGQEEQVESQEDSQEQEQEEQSADSGDRFDQHPRFKELIEYKNKTTQQLEEFQKREQDYQRQLYEMQGQLKSLSTPQQSPAQKQEEKRIVARLKQVDPEFADYITSLESKVNKLDDLEKNYQQLQQDQYNNKIQSEFDKLHTQNEVPDNFKSVYEAEIEKIAAKNPHLGIKDLPKVYSQVHNKWKETLDSIRREERKKYATTKKETVKQPVSQPKGKPVKASTKMEWSKDPDEAKRQAIQAIVKGMRSQRTNA